MPEQRLSTEHVALLGRIEAYRFDAPEAAITFASKLAQANGWSAVHTTRAIEEYRRFVFLAIAAGEPVSPSADVDKVWHQHLTWTHAYWDDFCPNVLGRPLHHEPALGGAQTALSLREQYARTLQAYERSFGVPAPSDLWPEPSRRFNEGLLPQRINTHRLMLVRRSTRAERWRSALLLTGAIALTALPAWRAHPALNAFTLIAIGLFAALHLQRAFRAPAPGSARPPGVGACVPLVAVGIILGGVAGAGHFVTPGGDLTPLFAALGALSVLISMAATAQGFGASRGGVGGLGGCTAGPAGCSAPPERAPCGSGCGSGGD